MKTSIFLRFAIALTACLLAGCGGSGGGSKQTSAQQTGAVRFEIQWPSAPAQAQGKERPSLIPLDAKSIVITIKDGGTIISGPTVIPAPAPGAAATATIPNLPLKALTALVEAKVDPLGQGAAETAASEMVTPTAGTPAAAPTLVLQSQITKLTISTPPAGIALVVGGTAFLSVTPTNAQGQVVMLDPNTKAIQWVVGPGISFVTGSASTGLSVQVTGTAAGGSTVSATYNDGSAATGDAVSLASNSGVPVQVVVQALPTGRPPNVPKYVDANLAIGPTGFGPGAFQALNDIALGGFYTADPGNGGFEVQKYTQNPDGSLGVPGTLASGLPGQVPDPSFNGNGTVNVTNATSVALGDGGSVYVVGDYLAPNASAPVLQTVFRFNAQGEPSARDASGNPAPYLPDISKASGIATDFQFNLFVAIAQNGATTVQVYSPAGASLTSLAGLTGTPAGLTVDLNDNIFVLANNTLVKLKPTNPSDLRKAYTQDASFGSGGRTTPMVAPARVAVDTRPGLPTTGNLYVTLPQNNQVEVFDKNGIDTGSLPVDKPLSTPTGIAIDNHVGTPTSGYIYIGNKTVPGTGNPTVDRAIYVFKPG